MALASLPVAKSSLYSYQHNYSFRCIFQIPFIFFREQVDHISPKGKGYVVEAHEKGGSKAAKDIDELVGEVTGLFAGGQLSEDALEGAMKALNDAYWLAKEKNKKYAPKKYRTQDK